MNKSAIGSSEDLEQEAVIEWCDLKRIPVVHIPNEGKRSAAYALRMKRMGLRPGFPDLFIPLARGNYHGLFIEMKYGDGRVSSDQKDWLELLSREGYRAAVCRGFDAAIKEITAYMRQGAIKSKSEE